MKYQLNQNAQTKQNGSENALIRMHSQIVIKFIMAQTSKDAPSSSLSYILGFVDTPTSRWQKCGSQEFKTFDFVKL